MISCWDGVLWPADLGSSGPSSTLKPKRLRAPTRLYIRSELTPSSSAAVLRSQALSTKTLCASLSSATLNRRDFLFAGVLLGKTRSGAPPSHPFLIFFGRGRRPPPPPT